MTPPENPERRGTSGGTTGSETTPPPWQRLSKDSGSGNGSGGADGYGDRWSSGQFPSDESAAAEQETVQAPLPPTGSGQSTVQPPAQSAQPTQSAHSGQSGQSAQAAPGTSSAQSADQGEYQTVVTGSAARRLFGDAPSSESAHRPFHDDGMLGRQREPVNVGGGRARTAPSALRRPGRGPRRASLQVKRFDPWSVLKLSLVLGVAMFFVWLVAVGVLYTVLDGMGVWDKLNGTYSSLVSGEGGNAPAEPLISAGRVFGIAAILGAINIVLISALATVSAFIYNVSADLAGGLEVTLSERE